MGKGTIVANRGSGLYTVEVNKDRRRVDRRLSDIATRTAENNTRINILIAVLIPTAQATFDDAAVDWNAAIAAYDPATKDTSEIQAKGEIYADAKTALERLTDERDVLKLKNKQMEKEKSLLNRVPPDQQIEAWCADLTDDIGAGDIVPLLELPSGETNIHPHSLTGHEDPAFDGKADGQLQSPIANTGEPWATMVNMYMSAACDKWKPHYRYGTITELAGDNCTIELDPCSSPWGFSESKVFSPISVDVNIGDILTDVPIEYMTCNGQAFSVGDHVVVQFPTLEWENRRVIGFVDNPKPCGGWIETFGPPIYDMGANDSDSWPDAWKLPGGNWTPLSDVVDTGGQDMGQVNVFLDRDNWGLTNGVHATRAFATRDQHKLLCYADTPLNYFPSSYDHTLGGCDLSAISTGDEKYLGVFILPGDNEDILFDGEVSADFAIWSDWTDMEVSVEMSHKPGGDPDDYPAICVVLYHSLTSYLDLAAGGKYPLATVVTFTNGIFWPAGADWIEQPTNTWSDYPLHHAVLNGRSCWSNRHQYVEELVPTAVPSATTRSCWIFDNQSAPHTWSYQPDVPTFDFDRTGTTEAFSGTFRVTRDEIRCDLPVYGISILNARLPGLFQSGAARVNSLRFYRNI